ncbi:unnamed protein product [Protopolystoma xenopodis]|uniref:Phospholipid/glycerol acyltransferase domain-containing protein n=1 Tax=Protopolystoma xenopodis TaxID=117903 RepID=A0A448XCG5_9PLAT|nr:unnamed protein product [Protopolystoma xenopodis]
MGIQARHFGDSLHSLANENCLVILNHRTNLDWLFIWGLGRRIHQLKIFLKRQLGPLPGVGWAMQCAGFVFLHRRLDRDQIRLEQAIKYLAKCKGLVQFMLFPEGTILNSGMPGSDRYAKKAGLPMLNYVLHPRQTGFLFIVNRMLELDSLMSEIIFRVSVLRLSFVKAN